MCSPLPPGLAQGRRSIDGTRVHRRLRAALAAVFFLLVVATLRDASNGAEPGAVGEVQDQTAERADSSSERRWNLHGQATVVLQGHPSFPAPYSGPRSLQPGAEFRNTVTVDLTAGVRLWRGAELYVDGLLWQGFGLSDTLGVAGFPNGEAFKVGTATPNVNFARVFLRQTFGLGGGGDVVEDDALQLPGPRDRARITVTVGKFSAKDVLDNNAYANDSRTQFLNWSFMANAAWDYPADALGFIPGVTLELQQPQWAARYGLFQVPRVANGLALDMAPLRAWSMAAEGERRYEAWGRPGAVRLLGYLTRAHMGSYEATLADPGLGADIAPTRRYRNKFGFGLNLEQELSPGLGAFLRAGWNDGRTETWHFTEVDRTVSLGISLKGDAWGRPDDTVGLAGAINGLSGHHRAFLAAGGNGLILGDGRLRYRLEQILEAYYSLRLAKRFWASPDYQWVRNPGYNGDRGPVHFLGIRFHAAL